MSRTVAAWLARRADNVAVILLTATFCVFILQIFSRYVMSSPLGWTLEACLLCWVWLVFWSGAFTLSDEEHVRFTIVSSAAGPRLKRWFAGLAGVCIVAAFAVSLWPTYDFVAFMAIEKTSLLKVRFDYVFSVYLIFAVAIIVRYAYRVVRAIRPQDTQTVNHTP